MNGDRIHNGAMDNASGIAGLIETAVAIRDAGTRLRRSLVFLAVTAEEKGLLGLALLRQPSDGARRSHRGERQHRHVPADHPDAKRHGLGVQESDLADDVRKAAKALGIEVLPDPEPERNIFTRSDQYSFIKRGVPANFPKTRLPEGFVRAPGHEEMAGRAVPRAVRRSQSAGRLQGGRRLQPVLSRGGRVGRQPAHASALERRQLLQTVRAVPTIASVSPPPAEVK